MLATITSIHGTIAIVHELGKASLMSTAELVGVRLKLLGAALKVDLRL